MLITDKQELQRFAAKNRIWQGIPGIEVTKKGRVFATFYSGKEAEGRHGNYAVVIMSDDGDTFTEPIVAAYMDEEHRCFDSCVWIDPLGRLWFVWATMPDEGTYAAICEDPDAEELVWSEEFKIGMDIMMNKPTVSKDGSWLFPVAVWGTALFDPAWLRNPTWIYRTDAEAGAYVYRTTDQGKTFEVMGSALVPGRQCDEHMFLELQDGRLAMYVRTNYGIGVAYSEDGGRSWTEGEDSGIKSPSTRFHIRRLRSGRILMVNHVDFTGRNNLAALLSEDDGKTWPYQLMLDTRDNVSYPDATEGEDGYLHITYDRERYKEVYGENAAIEILYARITEEDIMAGKLVSEKSRLRYIISKLS